MWFIYYGCLLTFVAVNEAVAKTYPILPKDDQDNKSKLSRHKRQFGFDDSDDNPGYSSNNDYPDDDDIFFDDDNRFQDFVRSNGNSQNDNNFQNNGFQNNGFQNNGFQNNGFQNNGFQNNFPNSNGLVRTTPPTTPAVTAVNIPGMGTTRSACEDRCLTTSQYNPVCGDNNVTYMNIERFNCAVRCGRNVRILAYRSCPRIIVR